MGGPYQGPILMPYQTAWLNDPSPVIVWEKSRRIGASFADALKSVLLAAKKKEAGGMNVNYLSYNKYMTQQYIQDAANWARPIEAAASLVQEAVLKDGDKDIITYQIKFASGHRIQALSSQPRSLRSTKGRVVIDEYAFVDQPEELLKAALALGMWGGQVAILSTHNGADNPFNELIQDIRGGRLPYQLHRTDFNQAVEQGLFKAVCRALNQPWSPEAEAQYKADIVKQYGEAAQEELFCVPRKSGGAYLPHNLIEAAMDNDLAGPVIRLSPPAADFVDWPNEAGAAWVEEQLATLIRPVLANLDSKHRHVFGVDFGRSGDLTSFWFVAEADNLSLYAALVVELSNMPFHIQEALLKAIGRNLPRFVGGSLDARGNGAALAEAIRREFGPELIHEVQITAAWYAAEMPIMKRRLEDKTYLWPKDAAIRDDMRKVILVGGLPKIDRQRDQTAQGQRHGDSAVAAAMASHAFRLAPDIDFWRPVFGPENETSRLLARFNGDDHAF